MTTFLFKQLINVVLYSGATLASRFLRHISTMTLIISTLLFQTPIFANSQGVEIIKQVQINIRPNHERRTLAVELLKHDVLVNKREMTYTFLLDDGAEKTLVKFLDPASIRGTALLLNDMDGTENKIWIYSPTDRKIRRISGLLRRNYFMGTEFTYEDFQGFHIDSKRYDYVEETPNCDAILGCFIVDSFELEADIIKNTGYSKVRYYIDIGTFYPIKIEYYDRNKKNCKTLFSSRVKKINRFYSPLVQHMKNICTGRSTKFTRTKIDNKSTVKSSELSKRALRRE